MFLFATNPGIPRPPYLSECRKVVKIVSNEHDFLSPAAAADLDGKRKEKTSLKSNRSLFS